MLKEMQPVCPKLLHIVADSGDAMEPPCSAGGETITAAVARLGSLRQSAHRFAFWIQLRGTAHAEAKEGRFRLRQGDWIAFDAGSAPELQADRTGVSIALLLPAAHARRDAVALDYGLFPGHGRMSAGERRLVLRLWRAHATRPASAEPARTLRPLLLHLHHLQRELRVLLERCPGRTATRKRQVLARMQRARMLQAGNTHRSVRLDELAELSRFSEWWVSKTFHTVYGETVQQASIRLRMERARELLEQTSLSISELSEICGFHDPCSFARLFKQCHGLTASRWRALHQVRGQIVSGRSPGSPAALAQAGT
ncbi:helix-turn-helix transcriptional regulator [Luteimonas sp. R10]|uniref:helix-turn-helix transcriptional regulator n=1 Tax=Luteimonas sp. R10 TaxID=3108176 RepID=UPI00308C95C9|nr:AraC family transcriptional regulator [Luteimonas sp. R10]